MEDYKNYEITEQYGKTVVMAGYYTLIGDFISEIEDKLRHKVAAGSTVYLWQQEDVIPNRVFVCSWDGAKLGEPTIEKTKLKPAAYFKSLAA